MGRQSGLGNGPSLILLRRNSALLGVYRLVGGVSCAVVSLLKRIVHERPHSVLPLELEGCVVLILISEISHPLVEPVLYGVQSLVILKTCGPHVLPLLSALLQPFQLVQILDVAL